jgi:hypothetical protein
MTMTVVSEPGAGAVFALRAALTVRTSRGKRSRQGYEQQGAGVVM